MIFLFYIVLIILFSIIHIVFFAKESHKKRKLEIVLMYMLGIGTGLGGTVGFIGHVFFADKIAGTIGWPAGNPFQYEVGMANLAIGVAGILCFFIRGNFWLATIVMSSVFSIGAAIIHIHYIINYSNYHPGNAGSVLYADILGPLLTIILYVLMQNANDKKGA